MYNSCYLEICGLVLFQCLVGLGLAVRELLAVQLHLLTAGPGRQCCETVVVDSFVEVH